MYDKFDKQKPFALLDTSKYPPEVAGRFNSFITTQFDDSLSVEMQMRSIIKWAIDNFKDMDQSYNDFTEYVVQGNLNPFIQFLNDLIEYMNNFIETFDEKYQETILTKMQEWYDNGELETLINESLDTKYHEMDNRLTDRLNKKALKTEVRLNTDMRPINYSELDTETKQMLTEGGALPVVDVKAVGRENLKDRSVSDSKINSIEVVSKNYVDKYDVTYGGYTNTAGIWQSGQLFKESTFIPVVPGQQWVKNSTLSVTFFDVNYNFVVGQIAGPQTIVVPDNENIHYMKVVYFEETQNLRLNKGTTLLPYEPYRVKYNNLEVGQENMGSDVRLNANQINEFVTVTTENMFNKETVSDGYYEADGSFFNSNVWISSDFIEVEEGVTYTKRTNGINSLWTADKEWVQAISGVTTFTIPTGKNIKYIRIIVYNPAIDKEMFVKGTTFPDTFIPHKKLLVDPNVFQLPNASEQKSAIHGKKWGALGDSNTDPSFSYVHKIAENTGVLATNYGLSGRALSSRGSTTDGQYPPGFLAYQSMSDDLDIVSVNLGVNDFHSQIPLGNNDSTTVTEFKGALNVLCEGLLTKYSGKVITLFTPFQRAYREENIPLSDYVQAIIDIGSQWGIPVYDTFSNSGFSPKVEVNRTKFTSDGLHLNNFGHTFVATRMGNHLESL